MAKIAKTRININSSDGNIFVVLAVAQRILTTTGRAADIEQMYQRVTTSRNLKEAIEVIKELVPEIEFYSSKKYEIVRVAESKLH